MLQGLYRVITNTDEEIYFHFRTVRHKIHILDGLLFTFPHFPLHLSEWPRQKPLVAAHAGEDVG